MLSTYLRFFLTDPDSMELNEIEILNMRCTNALNQDHSSSDSFEHTEKSGKVLKYKRRPIAPLPPPITQSATVYPPSQSWPGSQFPYYGYDQAAYKYPPPHIPSQQLNKLNQPFSTGLNFSNSLRPLLGPTSKLVQIEVHQHPHLYPLMLLHPQNSPQIFLGSAIFRVVVIQMLDLLFKRNRRKKQKAFR